MKNILSFLLITLLNLAVAVLSANEFTRYDFPHDFIFGSGTTAYQVEGAANEDGRTSSIWDTFCHAGYANGADGDIACDQYHKYKGDVQLMVETGLDAYRFSISWSRLIANGRGPVNPKGLLYYNNLINELISHGIQPHVTLHNYDLPQALEDEYGGWLNKRIVKDFTDYADVCFREFGDRVLYWTTVNEPNIFAIGSYSGGMTPPRRCSPTFGINCTAGNSSTEPYIAVHNILLSHASAAKLYKKKYQEKQHGSIGVSLYAYGVRPLTNSTEDEIATKRVNDFLLGWIVDPLVYGDYPDIMKKRAGSRLPSFTIQESELVRGSFDFLGIIHYLATYIKNNPSSLDPEQRDFNTDMGVFLVPILGNSSMNELSLNPWALQGVLEYFKQAYGNPPLYIHENGQNTRRNSTLQDITRVEYLHAYIGAVLDAVRNGSNTRGYFQWSFLDVLELLDGYESSYGLYYVDLDDPDLKRYAKLSAYWYSHFLRGGSVSSDGIIKLKNSAAPLQGSTFQ
ncbi:hypothetical protein SLE2022_332630 [Rubroshorea leprosula]